MTCSIALTHRVLDSPSFDAKTYYEQLITTSSLGTLLRRENELLSGTSDMFRKL